MPQSMAMISDFFIFLSNVKEHATLSAGAHVDYGVDVETTEEHVNRAADRGCRVSTCSLNLHSLIELTRSPSEFCSPNIGEGSLSERVPTVYPQHSSWLQDLECPKSRHYWGRKTEYWSGCNALLLLWQESGRPEIAWPEKSQWSLIGFLSCICFSTCSHLDYSWGST